MKKKNSNNEKMSFKNVIALQRNIYAVVLSIIFIAVVVAITILSTFLVEKYPLDIDLTTNKQHSISGKNFDYISNIDEEVNIYVAMSEDEYNCSTGTTADLGYVAASEYFVDYNSANMQYYIQTVELIKKYQSYNDKITVRFLDIYDSKTRDITDEFSDFSWESGDILVESTFMLDGEEVTRRTVVPFTDVYTLEDVTGMADQLKENAYYQMMGYTATIGQGFGYFITENNIETMVSSAIYKVTSPDTPVFLVPTTISDKDSIEVSLANVLKVNNYALEYSDTVLANLITPENYDKYAGIIISNCKSDITVEDRSLIDAFLDNNGKKGKSLFYFAGTTASKLTNLCGLLGDWGIGFGEGILYETDANYRNASEPTMLILESAGSEYTPKSDAMGKYYAGNNMVYMKQLWQNGPLAANVNRNTQALLNTGSFGQTVLMPAGEDPTEWTVPDDAEKEKFVTAIMTEDVINVGSDFYISHVVAFASADMISEDFSTDSWGNLNLVLETFNAATGNADAAFSFVPKTIESESYSGKVTEANTLTVRIIFMAAIPVLVIASGIVVWVRRKRK